MYVKAEPNAIRILEIYADEAAYREHLQTPHFKYYKESTADMVKSLKLVEMQALDDSAMPLIFKKLLSGVE
jgi:quinol monooxygenase YgiN